MSYPDVVIACIEHKVDMLEAFRQLRQRWWSTIIIWRIIPWWLTGHAACWFKLFSLWQSQHAVCHCQESGKTAAQCSMHSWWVNLNINPVRRRTRDVHSSCFLKMMYALFSDVSLRRQASMTQAGRTLFAQELVLVFNHLVRKADVAGCCSAGSVLRWQRLPRIQLSLICIVWSCFYVKLMQIN